MTPIWLERRPSFLAEFAIALAAGAVLAIAGLAFWLAMDWAVALGTRWVLS